MKKANSALYPLITRYLELKVALGRNYITERWILLSLDRFLTESQAEDLTIELFTRWCQRQNHLTSGVLRNRMRIVRNFCLYRQRTQFNCFVPDINLFPTSHQPIQPYIFTDAEIGRLLQAAQTIKALPRSPLRPEVFRLAVVLLYTTGLRRGELVRLTIADYDPREQTLQVRASKFHKSRILPLAADVAGEINCYFEARRRLHLPMSPDRPLVWNGYGHGYTGSGIWQGIRVLLRIADIRTSDGRLPRVHDMRHAFAANALLRWYRKGVDVQAKLPLLATYMGHVSIASTEYYLYFSEPLATASSTRFEACCGELVTPIVPSQGGAQ
jgi:integrase